jgi:hypothetical protein
MKIASLVLACLLAACASDLDTTRETVDRGSFGSTVVTLVCKRIAYLDDLADGDGRVDVRGDTYREICRAGAAPPANASAELKALQAERDDLVAAIDAAMPRTFLPDLQAMLTASTFLAAYDDGRAIAAVDALIGTLRLAADDTEFIRALERLSHRTGYRPAVPELGAMRAMAAYPGLRDVLADFLAETSEGGSARAQWQELVTATGVTLRNAEAEADPASPERTGRLALDLLLGERPLLDTSRTIPMVARDHRGVARATPAGIAALLADTDGDGLADVDDLGRFVDAEGALIDAPAPFAAGDVDTAAWPYRDEQGRPLTAEDGALIYEYVDLDATLLAALARDMPALFASQGSHKGTVLEAVRGASVLMGPRRSVTRAYAGGDSIQYQGFDTAASPLLDMVYGYLQVLRYSAMDDVLALARNLFDGRQAEISRLMEALIEAARLGDAYPELRVDPGSPLWDDLVPVLRQIVDTPGLAEELLVVLERPQMAELALRFGDYMTYTDQFTYNPDTQAVIGSLGTLVDRSAPDSNWNRSIMQRLLHLVADTANHTLCNKQDARVELLNIGIATYDECELLQIDDVAAFYVRSMAYFRDSSGNFVFENGRYRPAARFEFNWGWIGWFIDEDGDLIEWMVGIEGFRTHPTPEALNRTLLLDPAPPRLADMIDPPVCRDGHLYKTGHGGTIPAWEATGFYPRVQPLVQPFVDRGAEHLFVQLMVVLHNHWPSRDSINHQQALPQEGNYAYASDLAAYEPLIADILRKDALVPALVSAAPVLNATRVNGRDFDDIVLGAARYLLAPQAGLARRDGSTQTTTADGRPVTVLSPWHVLADAYAAKHAAIAAAGEQGQAWPAAISDLIDVLMRGEEVQGTGWRFRNPRTRGVLLAVIDFLRARMALHRTAGDVDAWLSEDLPARMEDVLAGPMVATASDFIQALEAAPQARQALEAMIAYVFTEANIESFDIMITSVGNMLMLALDDRDMVPIARFVGEVMRPERGWLDNQLAFVNAAASSDQNDALRGLLGNLYSEHRAGRSALSDILDGVSEVHRDRPYDDRGQRFGESDYRTLLRGVADFLDDEKRGLRKFIAIIEGRNL